MLILAELYLLDIRDTGYRAEAKGPVCPAFEQIGKRYGPMDFSAIPIWRGGTLNFVSYMGVRVSSILSLIHAVYSAYTLITLFVLSCTQKHSRSLRTQLPKMQSASIRMFFPGRRSRYTTQPSQEVRMKLRIQ